MGAVILATAVATSSFLLLSNRLQAQELVQESGRKAPDPGPRAVGLVQLSSKGKARLIPIAIMLDGKFFDAGSYKAAPVPMALDFGVIYEGFKTGVSQGLFTITQPGQLNHNWIAEGTWLPDGMKAQTNTKKYAPPVIDDDDSKSDRPTLHRRKEGAADKDDSKSSGGSNSGSSNSGSSNSGSTNSTTASNSPPSSPSSTGSTPSTTGSAPSTNSSRSGSPSSSPSTTSGSTSASPASTPKGNDSSKPSSSSTSPTSRASASDEEPISDPNRPVLRRGKPDPNAHHEAVNFDDASETPQLTAAKTTSAKGTAPASDSGIYQVFPAISDAKGPDPRPYTYDLKPAEEAIYRNKMLELAATLIKTNGRPTPPAPASSSAKKSAANAAVKPRDEFEDVHIRAFDLSFTNEPTLVLSARTTLPPTGAPVGQVPKEITLVARTDLEGDLQKLFFAQTDSRHLDVSPRMELIDAVDADGDGRGELLFRETSDAGSGYAIYRVAADKLWPLYESTP
jgi:hypothetical protein